MTELVAHLDAVPGWTWQAAAAGLDAEDLGRIGAEAERFAAGRLAPLAGRADRDGCRLERGRVRTPPGYADAYRALGQGGWIAPDLTEALGGQGLPIALHAAASIAFEAAAMPFMMLAGASRAGAHLLAQVSPDLAGDWAPRLSAGEWTATICISEPEAGSDLGRIRTKAKADGDRWRIDGGKCWISFGDHDMSDRIGHLLLARTGPAKEGTRGLSLFLVPDRDADGARGAIAVERIEDKLGLHGSPTCALRFEGAAGMLVGDPGRGLQALFGMIELMRLQTACQGAGIARAAARLARDHAEERRQGGDPAAPAVPIARHPDVQRQLARLDAQAEILRALALDLAVTLGAARAGDDQAAARTAFLLPLAKTFGGEIGFEAASGAIQVLGGAGYTRDWPAERLLRDARILTLYEGTTGMQAQDFLFRRLIRDGGAGLAAFARAARDELGRRRDAEAQEALRLVARFETLSAGIATRDRAALAAAADGYLRAGWCAVSAVLAARLCALPGRSAAAGQHWLATAAARMTLAECEGDLRA